MKKITEKLKQVYTTAKDLTQKLLDWNKEEVWAKVLKILFIIFLITCIYFLICIAPYIFAIVILLLCSLPDKMLSFSNTQQLNNVTVENNFIFTRDILCRILRENSEILNIYLPQNVKDIVPAQYSSLKYFENIPCFRFIILPKQGHEKDFEFMREFLNQKICQNLQSGNSMFPTPFYNELPCLYVIDINEDLYHQNHFYIDVMPITDDKSYNYIKDYSMKKNAAIESEEISLFLDEDF